MYSGDSAVMVWASCSLLSSLLDRHAVGQYVPTVPPAVMLQ